MIDLEFAPIESSSTRVSIEPGNDLGFRGHMCPAAAHAWVSSLETFKTPCLRVKG